MRPMRRLQPVCNRKSKTYARERGHGRGGGGAKFGQGRDCGRGNGAAQDPEPQDTFKLYHNDNFQRRFRMSMISPMKKSLGS